MSEESGIKEPVIAEEVPTYYDALAGLLNQVQLNDQTKEIVLRNYRARPQEFEQNAMRMMNYLTALGVRDNIARFLASRFWSITQNIDVDMFQNLLTPSQPNPYGMGGMGFPPTSMTPAQQYPLPSNQAEDADTKMMRMMMMMKMMNQPATSSVDPMQQMMQMKMMSGGRMGMSQEPVYLANGQPAQDSSGNQIMRFTMTPAMQQQPYQQGPDPSLELFKEIIKGQNEQKRAADDRYFQTMEKQRAIEGEIAEKESRALRRRLAMVEQSSSSDRLIEDVEKLRKLGLFAGGGNNPSNIEAIKLQTDLDRWKYERETDLVRWQQSQEMDARKWYKERELEEIRENRTQDRLGILGESLKDTIQTVVTPILSSMSSGVASGIQGGPSQQVESPDLTKIDDDSLLKQYHEVERIGSRANEARAMLKTEMEGRIASRGHQVPETPSGVVPRGFQEQPKIDLGPMTDLQFAVSPTYENEEDDDGYQHADELLDSIEDVGEEDYATEY